MLYSIDVRTDRVETWVATTELIDVFVLDTEMTVDILN